MEYNLICSFFLCNGITVFFSSSPIFILYELLVSFFNLKKRRHQVHLSIRKGRHYRQAPLVLTASFASHLFKLGPVQGPAKPMGILPFQHLQTPVTRLWPNQHLVICINSAQSEHTLGPSQEKCQPLLREPRANSSGLRFHLPIRTPQESPGSCCCQATVCGWAMTAEKELHRVLWKPEHLPVSFSDHIYFSFHLLNMLFSLPGNFCPTYNY